jgi:enoyl-CoA hydratase/carnithine racemase
MSENLLIHREGRLVRLTLNRPEKRNALDLALCRGLLAALQEAAADPSVGAILLEASGLDFCAGMDLSEVLEADPEQLLAVHRDLFTLGARLEKPMVAQVQGSAIAGGLGLALNAHMIIAETNSRFGLTETRLGLWPYVIFNAVAAALGVRKTTELALTARIIDAEEARRIGIVDVLVDLSRLREEGHRIAQGLAQASAGALRDGLRFVREIERLGGSEVTEKAIEYRRRTLDSPDFREGVMAYREKRAPVWPSHRH